MALTSMFVGAHGQLGIAVTGTPAMQADFNAINDAYTTAIVGRVTDVELCVRTDLEEFYEIGFRDVRTILPSNVRVTGSVGRAYINGALLYLLLGRGATETEFTTIDPGFSLNLTLNDPAIPNNKLKVNVFGVKFESWALVLPQDSFVMEKVRFKAKKVILLDAEDGKDIAVKFPPRT